MVDHWLKVWRQHPIPAGVKLFKKRYSSSLYEKVFFQGQGLTLLPSVRKQPHVEWNEWKQSTINIQTHQQATEKNEMDQTKDCMTGEPEGSDCKKCSCSQFPVAALSTVR